MVVHGLPPTEGKRRQERSISFEKERRQSRSVELPTYP
jgi:hypothetical protein